LQRLIPIVCSLILYDPERHKHKLNATLSLCMREIPPKHRKNILDTHIGQWTMIDLVFDCAFLVWYTISQDI